MDLENILASLVNNEQKKAKPLVILDYLKANLHTHTHKDLDLEIKPYRQTATEIDNIMSNKTIVQVHQT